MQSIAQEFSVGFDKKALEIKLWAAPETKYLRRLQNIADCEQSIFESLLLSPSIGIQAEPPAQVRQRKCRQGAEIVEDIEKSPRMLPKDTPSTEFEESSLAMPRCKRARNRVQGIRACGGFARVGEAVTIPHGSHLVNFYVSLEDSNALMDALIIEMNQAWCYDMIEEYCDFIGKQLSSLQKQRECPQESREAVSTLIFAASRFPDLPELCKDLRHIFTGTYGSLEPFISHEVVLWVRQRKCRQGAEIVEDTEKRPRMLPKDTPSTEFEESSLAIHDLWLNFFETSALDHREVVLPLARSFQWIQMKGLIALRAKDLCGIIGRANIDIIFGTSGQSVKEMASTSNCQQSLNVVNKNNADTEMSILSLVLLSLCSDNFLTEPLVWIPSADNTCIAQQFYEIFTSWEKMTTT